MRKVCVFTGTRAEYGLLKPLMDEIKKDKELKLQILASGMHLSSEFGLTYKEIEKDGFVIDEKIKILSNTNTPLGINKSIGTGFLKFSRAYSRLKPDIIVILGDRFEAFAAAASAMVLGIPIAHISGGDVTEGIIDEQMRHAITKMSHIHFVSIDKHRARVRKMGEEPSMIYTVGEPCIDRINDMKKISRTQLEKILGIRFFHPTILVTFHPVTLQPKETSAQIRNLLRALGSLKAQIIFTYPNADAGGRKIIYEIKRFIKAHPNATAFKSLGSQLYLNLLSHVDVVVGNSSSALVEAPSFKLPAVNIGKRQGGRLAPKNVIFASEQTASILRGIKKALSPGFKKGLMYMKNPYDKGGAAKRIVKVLSEVELCPELLFKKFVD